jgi:hypothetical protein
VAAVEQQRAEAQARAAALINALPEQADVLNDNVVAELLYPPSTPPLLFKLIDSFILLRTLFYCR